MRSELVQEKNKFVVKGQMRMDFKGREMER